jgi:serine/threonine protein kinase
MPAPHAPDSPPSRPGDTLRDSSTVPIPGPTPPLADVLAARYRLGGEIARGGMGAVLRGHDPVLGRDLAVKVLLEEHQDWPELERRFVEEACIGGQLQHPGVAPSTTSAGSPTGACTSP